MKVSILSAVQNEEQHLGTMITSVLAQTHRDWELLIVDDRSTDRTSDVIGAHADGDARVIRVDNTGVSGKNDAWNRAFRAATGDVVVFMGGDDLMPPDALTERIRPLQDLDCSAVCAAVFAKVRMFSDDRRFDGVVVPRGAKGSRSGGTTALTRAMAAHVFPIDTSLPNEDLWTSVIVELRSSVTFDVPAVVVDYRIHGGNSFQRDQSFAQADAAYHARGLVYERLLEAERLAWSPSERAHLELHGAAERLRHSGRWFSLLRLSALPLQHRARLSSQASPVLYRLRQRFYGLLSGW